MSFKNQNRTVGIFLTPDEVPILRLEEAIKQKKTLFRPFKIPLPYESSKDIFCIRSERTTDDYRRISFQGFELRVPVDPYEKVELRVIPDEKKGITEIRIWHKMKLKDIQTIKTDDLKLNPF